MISNKRFSYAPASSSGSAFHPADYQTGSANGHHLLFTSGGKLPEPMPTGSHLLYQRKAKDRNSLSLNHEFSHMYVTKPNPNALPVKNYGTSQTKSFGRSVSGTPGAVHSNSNVDILPTLEEVQKHKRSFQEAKKQMTQMEKSISFWCDCTDYWRTKWRKTKEEKRKYAEEVKDLKAQVSALQKQLKSSEDKRSKLQSKFQEVSQKLPATKLPGNHTSGSRNFRETPEEVHVYGQIQPTGSATSKIMMRGHERLLDKKITNRKRFSQVVMCDAEELFQMSQLPVMDHETGTLTQRGGLPVTEEEPEVEGYGYRLPEVNEEDGFRYAEEDELPVEGGDSDLRNVSLKVRQHLLKGISGTSGGVFSTLETNSECVNVGSINDDQSTAIGGDDSTANDDDDDDDDDDIDDDKNLEAIPEVIPDPGSPKTGSALLRSDSRDGDADYEDGDDDDDDDDDDSDDEDDEV